MIRANTINTLCRIIIWILLSIDPVLYSIQFVNSYPVLPRDYSFLLGPYGDQKPHDNQVLDIEQICYPAQ